MLKIGDKFKLTDDALDNYGEEYGNEVFTVSHVATNKKGHRGYDDSMKGMALYDSKELNFSVYEYEIKEVGLNEM